MTELDKAKKCLRQMYEVAVTMPFVQNKIAYALYQTWKIYDMKSKEQEGEMLEGLPDVRRPCRHER